MCIGGARGTLLTSLPFFIAHTRSKMNEWMRIWWNFCIIALVYFMHPWFTGVCVCACAFDLLKNVCWFFAFRIFDLVIWLQSRSIRERHIRSVDGDGECENFSCNICLNWHRCNQVSILFSWCCCCYCCYCCWWCCVEKLTEETKNGTAKIKRTRKEKKKKRLLLWNVLCIWWRCLGNTITWKLFWFKMMRTLRPTIIAASNSTAPARGRRKIFGAARKENTKILCEQTAKQQQCVVVRLQIERKKRTESMW